MKNRWVKIGIAVVLLIFIGAYLSRGKKTPQPENRTNVVSTQELYERANALNKNNEKIKARELYKKIISDYPDFKDVDLVQRELEDLTLEIIFSRLQSPETVIHEIKKGEILGKLAKKYKTTVELIKKSNKLKSDTIRVGQRIRIWTGTFSVFVDKSQNILILSSNGEVIKVYQVATGSDNNTPVGTFTIINKLRDPVWFKSGAIIPPESPKNVLGSRWMGFDIPGYGIHGTVEPETIGQQITAGCVRMRNEEVEELYSLLPVGTKVTVVD